MVTKSIALTEDEASELEEYLGLSGEAEATVLKEVVRRGLRELRIERGIRAFREGKGSSEAAEIVGVHRAEFLVILMDRGEKLLEGPSTLAEELEFLAEQQGNERLAAVARKLAEGRD